MQEEIMICVCAIGATVVIIKRNRARKQVREAVWATLILWVAAFVQVAVSLHLPVSLPTDWISILFEPIYVPIMAWLKGG